MARQKVKRPNTPAPPSPAPPQVATGMRPADVGIVLALAALCALAFGGTLEGQFVYDDMLQIQSNPLIQHSSLFWTALTSDVWAFKGAREDPWSNYWRPGFILWLMLNVRLFGIVDPTGWHVSTIFLHALATGLGYVVLRQMKLGRAVAAAAAMIFAVHPIHVESVAWISGCTDPLMAAGMLGSLSCVLSALDRPRPWKTAAAVALYAFTMSTKETAVVFPVVVFVTAFSFDPKADAAPWEAVRKAVRVALPFAAVAVVFFLARYLVLATVEIRPPWHGGLPRVVRTAPSVLAFYLRQLVAPFGHMGPMYPVRAVDAGHVGFSNFVLPAALVLAAAAAAVVAAWRIPARQVGLVLFALVLLPALNVNVFVPEQVVHDRYLYLPLLGALAIFGSVAVDALASVASIGRKRAGAVVLAASAVACLPLLRETWLYNSAWMSNIDLWSWAIRSDPTSASSLTQLALHLEQDRGQTVEARKLLDRAIVLIPNLTAALRQRATIALREKRYADAERDYLAILDSFPADVRVISNLAVCYEQQERLADAERVLRTGREKAPHAYCSLTDPLAIVLYQQGRREEALKELEAARGRVASEYDSSGTRVLYRLGMLYRELGRQADASAALDDFLRATENVIDPSLLELRRSVLAWRAGSPAGGAARTPGH